MMSRRLFKLCIVSPELAGTRVSPELAYRVPGTRNSVPGTRNCPPGILCRGANPVPRTLDAAPDWTDACRCTFKEMCALYKPRLTLAALTLFVTALGNATGAQPAAATTCSPAMVRLSTTAKAKPQWLDRMQVYADQGQTSAALEELEKAARSADRLALIMLGDVLERGVCGPADPTRAGELYAEAVRRGDGMAMLFLGHLLETGKIRQDLERARDLYRRSLLDLWLPEDELWTIVYGASMGWRGISPLLREQRQWLKSVLADPERALALSDQYLARRPPEGTLACRLLVRTKPMTETISLQLARIHLGGLGVDRNFHNARVFSHRAAVAGNAEAHYLMGRLLLDGQPDAPAPLYALVWLLRARDLGVKVDERYVQRAASTLSVEDRRLAEDWAKSPPPPLPRIYGHEPSQPFCASSD